MNRNFAAVHVLLAIAITGSSTFCVADTVVQVVSGENATAGKSIGAFSYDPSTNSICVTAFGFSGSGGNAAIRKITNVDGNQVSSPLVSEAQMRLFYIDGDTDRSATGPTPSGMLLNPVAIGDIPAFSMALLADASLTRLPAENVTDPAATKRIIGYNLDPLLAFDEGSMTWIASGDPLQAFSAQVTLGEMNTVAGASPTNGSSNTGRQFAWSGDGQSIYFMDSLTSGVGGLWKYEVGSGSLNRLLGPTGANTEPAVLSAGGVDTILFRGVEATGNLGGIDRVTHDGVSTGAITTHVSGAALADFMETTTADITIFSMATDAQGNLYFSNTDNSPDRRGIYQLDTEGRLAKVMSHAERVSVSGGTNSQMLRMQPRTVSYEGPDGSFDVTQILFADSNTHGVLGAHVFQPGDFNRDNVLDAADIELFKSRLTVRGVLETDVDNLKFDLNGNNVIDWKDVKVLQQFADFGDGDADMNGFVDLSDYAILEANWLQTGKTFMEGDFNGDDVVNLDDYNLWRSSLGYASSVLTGATPNFVPGDFNGDFAVDGADFVIWQTNFPLDIGGTLATGDANGDGVVDGADFVIWQTNFPFTIPGPPETPSNVVVPEPASGLLMLTALASAFAYRRRSRT